MHFILVLTISYLKAGFVCFYAVNPKDFYQGKDRGRNKENLMQFADETATQCRVKRKR